MTAPPQAGDPGGTQRIGPGRRPELRWLPVDRLAVDRRYQRTLDGRNSEQLIKRIAENFRWAMFQAILVTQDSERPGYYWIIDGQHRVAAATAAGLSEVPSVIVAAPSVGEQAVAFVGANQGRVAVNPYALYHARLAAGEEKALRTADVCRNAGIVIPRYPIPAGKIEAGVTVALGIIERLSVLSPVVGGLAIGAVANAYRSQPGGLRAAFFQAAGKLIANQPQAAAAEYAKRITEALRGIGWGQLENLAASRRSRYGGTLISATEAVIVARLPPPARALARPGEPAPFRVPARPGANPVAGGERRPGETLGEWRRRVGVRESAL